MSDRYVPCATPPIAPLAQPPIDRDPSRMERVVDELLTCVKTFASAAVDGNFLILA